MLILNHYSPNKGDRAVLHFILRELGRANIGEVSVSCSEPEMTRSWLHPSESNIKLVPWGAPPYWPSQGLRFSARKRHLWGLWARCSIIRELLHRSMHICSLELLCNRSFSRALRQNSIAISTGGHHVSTLVQDNAFCCQIYDMALALLAGKRLVLWSQTIGPFHFTHAGSKRLVQDVLLKATEIWIRDEGSVADMERIGVIRDTFSTYDSAFGLADTLPEFVPPSQREAVAGIAVYTRPGCAEEYYICSIARLANSLLQRGIRIRFFPMEVKGTGGDDRPLIREILRHVRDSEQCQIVDQDLHPLEHLSEVSKCRLFIGHKTHSVVFALATSTPLVALAYHRKTQDFMDHFGLSRFCISDVILTDEIFWQKTSGLLDELDVIAECIHARSVDIGKCVRDDFRSVLQRNKIGLG